MIDTPEPATPITVPASPIPMQATAAVRTVLYIVSALPALLAVLGTHDVMQIIAYLNSEQGLQVLGVAVAAATFVWQQWKARHVTGKLQALEAELPDRIAKRA